MLLALVTAQREQSLRLLNVDSMKDNRTSVACQLREHVKHTKPGSKGLVIVLKSFPSPRMCVVTTLREYIIITTFFREPCSQLLLSYVKPYRSVSRDTLD